MKLSNNLGKDSVLGLVFKLAIPTMLAQLVNLLYSIVDRMYIGHIPEIGGLALAGVGVCGPIVTFLSSFGTLVGLGGSIIMSIKMGERRFKKARFVLANSFLALSIISITLTIIFLLLKDKLIMMFGASTVTFPYANTYLTIYTLGSFFALMAIGLNFFITCQGFAMIGMLTVIIGALVNILLDTVFIFGLEMGVAGAAWATVIAQITSFAFAFRFLTSKKIKIPITFKGYSFEIVQDIIKFGFSPFFILTTDSIILIALNAMLQKYGGTTQGDLLVSGATIIQSYLLLITGPLIGLSGGTQPLLSFNYGARQIERVKKAEKYIVIFALVLTTTMFILTPFISPYFISLFTDEVNLAEVARWGIKASVWGIIPLSFQYCFVDGFTAVGRIKTAFSLSMFRKMIYMGSTFFLPAIFEARSAFYAQPVSDILGAIASTTVFYFVFNKHLERRKKILQVLTTTMFILTPFISPYFISLFTDEVNLAEVARWGIKASVWGIIPLSFQYCFVDGFTAVGRIKTAFSLSMFRKMIYMGSTFFLPAIFEARSAFYAQPVSDILGAIASTTVFYFIFNKHLERRKKVLQ